MKRSPKFMAAMLGLTLLGGLTTAVHAQDEITPEADTAAAQSRAKALDVIERFIEAIGGKARLEEKNSRRIMGSITVMGQTGTMEVLMIPDGPFLQKTNIPALGLESLSGSDGTRGWSFDSMTGATIMPDEMHEQLIRESDPGSLLRFDETYVTIEYLGESEFEGTAVESIRVVDKAGMEATQHFSIESGLLIGGESEQDSPMGKMKSVSVVTEYQDFNGLKIATKTTMKMGPMEMLMTINEVELGNVNPEDLAPPPAVQKMLEKVAKKEAEAAEADQAEEVTEEESDEG